MNIKQRIKHTCVFATRKGHLYIYLLIITLILFGFIYLWNFRIQSSLRLAEESLTSVKGSISYFSQGAVHHIRLLQTAASRSLKEPLPPKISHPLYGSLQVDLGGASYSIGVLPSEVKESNSSYLVGGGSIPAPDSPKAREMELALQLNPLFADVKKNIPDATWIYYYSENRFINLYPFEPQALPWSEEWMTHPLFADTKPERNPTRVIRWHDVYMDEAGKGLMTSIVAPVFDNEDRFRAMVGIDFTLKSITGYIVGTGLDIGIPLLVDQHGHLLAHPTVTGSAYVVKELKDVLPAELMACHETLLELTPNVYHEIAGWKVFVTDVEYAPWRIVFLINKRNLDWQVLGSMWAECIVGLLLILVIFILEQRQRMAETLIIFKAAIDSSSAGIFIVNRQGIIQYVNESFIKVTGFAEAEAVGKKTDILGSGETPSEVYHDLWTTILAGESWQHELLNRKKDGTLYWANVLIAPVSNDEKGYFVVVMEDITERKKLQELLQRFATIDPLTGVANRRHFMERLEGQFQEAIVLEQPLSLLMLDIDYFKDTNDSYGHAAGDLVLQHFTAQCLACLRSEDSMGRLGGEEFAILLPETALANAREIAEQIRARIEETAIPIFPQVTIRITCSIGVAQRGETEYDMDSLLSRADMALYEAKHKGRNRVSC